MERTPRQITAAAANLQRKLRKYWNQNIMTITADVAPEGIHLQVTAADGAVLAEQTMDPNTGAWELYREGQSLAGKAVSVAINNFLARTA